MAGTLHIKDVSTHVHYEHTYIEVIEQTCFSEQKGTTKGPNSIVK